MKSINLYISSILYKIFLKLFSKKKQSKKIYSSEKLNILLIQFGSLKEALIVTPLIKVLQTNINCSINLLATKNNESAFLNNGCISNIFLQEKEPLNFVKSIINLYRNNFDVIIDLHEHLNKDASVIMGLLNANYKVGFSKEDVNLLTHIIFLQNPNRVHIVDRILSLTDAFEIYYSKADLNIMFNTNEPAKKTIEEYLIKHDLTHKFKVMINISADLGVGFWGQDNYKKLIKYIEDYKVNVIISASINDIETAELLSNNKHIIYYNTDFEIFAELVKNVDFIFSPDSFLVQLAAAYKIPIFCLFVQHKTAEMINVPYNSDFDFALTEKQNLADISYGKVLNSFISYFEYIFEKFNS